jgi:hypothetical protein
MDPPALLRWWCLRFLVQRRLKHSRVFALDAGPIAKSCMPA